MLWRQRDVLADLPGCRVVVRKRPDRRYRASERKATRAIVRLIKSNKVNAHREQYVNDAV